MSERLRGLNAGRSSGGNVRRKWCQTRSGKGVSLVIPTLLAWNESAIIYGIKGENWAKTAGFRSQQGHICFRFCPVEQSYGSKFNPLAEVRFFTDRDVSEVQNIAEILGRTHGAHTPSNPHWQDTGVSIICGIILLCRTMATPALRCDRCGAPRGCAATSPAASHPHRPARQLNHEKAVQLRAEVMDQNCGSGEITILITGHQHFQIAVRVHFGISRSPNYHQDH
jgi:type IV secretory pathway TraG/TraD family ATPase VirD4